MHCNYSKYWDCRKGICFLRSSHTAAVAVKFYCLGDGSKIVSGLILTLPPSPLLPLQCVGTFTVVYSWVLIIPVVIMTCVVGTSFHIDKRRELRKRGWSLVRAQSVLSCLLDAMDMRPFLMFSMCVKALYLLVWFKSRLKLIEESHAACERRALLWPPLIYYITIILYVVPSYDMHLILKISIGRDKWYNSLKSRIFLNYIDKVHKIKNSTLGQKFLAKSKYLKI
ncbi:hypothetical protein AGLY_006653 [Aphis glycines]|uniref:Uncharacterized protein n=1 Tax=Aphis glycines TaxID=307491 RepID=A0A6G0TRM9_APHGL|nr:hypothetical protein AGLY_006653 [Aphis glycines]